MRVTHWPESDPIGTSTESNVHPTLHDNPISWLISQY